MRMFFRSTPLQSFVLYVYEEDDQKKYTSFLTKIAPRGVFFFCIYFVNRMCVFFFSPTVHNSVVPLLLTRIIFNRSAVVNEMLFCDTSSTFAPITETNFAVRLSRIKRKIS